MSLFDNISMEQRFWNRKWNVDIVYIIDASKGMQPLINTFRQYIFCGYFTKMFEDKCANRKRRIQNLRTKVIVFRNLYDGSKDSILQSGFYLLPKEFDELMTFVNSIHEAEENNMQGSGLEALASAICLNDYISDDMNNFKIVVLFTDVPALSLEQQQNSESDNYPKNIPRDLFEFRQVWNGIESMLSSVQRQKFDKNKRMLIFAPEVYPWIHIRNFAYVKHVPIESGNGGVELSTEIILNELGSIWAE